MRISLRYIAHLLIKTLWHAVSFVFTVLFAELESIKISNDQELIQSGPISCPQIQTGNN